MKNSSQNEIASSPHNVANATMICIKKRTWISPEIVNWENENIENVGGGVVDGGLQSYL